MLKFIDNFLNKITMYRLTLYALVFIFLGGLVLSIFEVLPHDPLSLLSTLTTLILGCYIFNKGFAFILKAPINVESHYITALILALVVPPAASLEDIFFLISLSAIAMGSKYILAIRKKHIWNPAALALVVSAFVFGQGAGWWAGALPMIPFVAIGGLLVVRKTQRFDLVITFFVTSILLSPANWEAILLSPLLFFATIMLTEPLTSPPNRRERVVYGVLVGVLAYPALHIGPVYSTPELALVIGNIFAYLVSPKQKLVLELKEKVHIARDTYDFVFKSREKLRFAAGQYLEWTLPHARPDSRGNRRYFTLSSSPTEEDIRIGVKFYPNGSSFKNKLITLAPSSRISAGALAGEFTLPRNKDKKLVFLAGGIGITPFRSMLKELMDKNERRDIVLFYSVRERKDLAYDEIIEEAKTKLGVRPIYIYTDNAGLLTGQAVAAQVPDLSERYFYISGTRGMVVACEKMLRDLGIPKSRIKKDFFPGYV